MSLSPFVGLGLISYSVYLWHFPIFAFSRYGDLTISNFEKLCWITITILLSVVSFHVIERPFRRSAVLSRGHVLIIFSLTSTLIIFGCSYVMYMAGFPARLEKTFPMALQQQDAANQNPVGKLLRFTDVSSEKPIVLIIGDSYSLNWSALADDIDASRYNVLVLKYSSCFKDNSYKPLRITFSEQNKSNCETFFKWMGSQQLVEQLSHIILVSHRPMSYDHNLYRFELIKSIQARALHDPKIFVVGNYWQLDRKQDCLSLMFMQAAGPEICVNEATYNTPKVELLELQWKTEDQNTRLIKLRPVGLVFEYINLFELLLEDTGKYPSAYKGVPFMRDWNHFTPTFVNYVATKIVNYNGDSEAINDFRRLLRQPD